MKLIMTKCCYNTKGKLQIANQLNGKLSAYEYDGLSTKEIEHTLKMEEGDIIIVTADSRFMRYVREDSLFKLEDVFIYREGELRLLKETTKRILRYGHNMMKLYESGEFEFH